MTASSKSISQIADIMEEYLIKERYDYVSIAARLKRVTGSASVIASCNALAKEIERRAPKR